MRSPPLKSQSGQVRHPLQAPASAIRAFTPEGCSPGPGVPQALEPAQAARTPERLRIPDAPGPGTASPAGGRVWSPRDVDRARAELSERRPPRAPAPRRLPCLRAAAMRVPRPRPAFGVPSAASVSAPVDPPTTAGVPNPGPGSPPLVPISRAPAPDWLSGICGRGLRAHRLRAHSEERDCIPSARDRAAGRSGAGGVPGRDQRGAGGGGDGGVG